MKAFIEPYTLYFKQSAGTSRGTLYQKKTYFLHINDQDSLKHGIGECNMFKGLSADDVENYEEVLQQVCSQINAGNVPDWTSLLNYPSIQFGLEQALLSYQSDNDIIFESDFTNGSKGIPINGLIWMGKPAFMRRQIDDKIKQGFTCLKLKIGTNWEAEKEILTDIRKAYPVDKLTIRVDANGAFSFEEAKIVLDELNALNIHSIEQPIKAGNIAEMSVLCLNSATPIALDEELIGIFKEEDKIDLIKTIKPQYIILKPALIGGFEGCREWINAMGTSGLGWWITSALESNIGLNNIAQYTATLKNPLPQGLGTGGLFTNNIDSSLRIRGEELWHH